MRRVLLPVLGALLLVALCSALVADCAERGDGNGISNGAIPGRYPWCGAPGSLVGIEVFAMPPVDSPPRVTAESPAYLPR